MLENLRDRHPEMFTPRAGIKPPNPRKGDGHKRCAQARAAKWIQGWAWLLSNSARLTQRAVEADMMSQLEQTGGYEAVTNG